jgi:hypothetical protein
MSGVWRPLQEFGGGSGVRSPGGGTPTLPVTSGLWALWDERGLPASGAIAAWNDSSGNSRNLLQATGANQPVVSTFGPRGLRSALFDGVDDFLAIAGLLLPVTFSYYYCYKANANTRQVPIGDFQSVPANSGTFIDQNESSNAVIARQFNNWNSTGNGNSQTQTRFCSGRVSGSTSTIRFGGAFVAGLNVGGVYLAPVTLELRMGTRAGGLFPVSGNILEMGIYDRETSDSEILSIEAYCAAKHATV